MGFSATRYHTDVALQCNTVNSCFFGKNFHTVRRAGRRSARASAAGPCIFGCGPAALRYPLSGKVVQSEGIVTTNEQTFKAGLRQAA
jgi:hypothetical protein